MENQTKSQQPTPLPGVRRTHFALWLIIGLAIVAGLGVGAYFFVLRNTNTVPSTNIASDINDENVNDTINGATNVTDAQTYNTITTTKPQTITYQRLDHGLQLSFPAGWSVSYPNVGTHEGWSFISFFSSKETKSSNGGVTYYTAATGTLADWFTAHKQSYEQSSSSSDIIDSAKEGTLTINGQQAYRITTVRHTDYGNDSINDTPTQAASTATTSVNVFLKRDTRIYEINFQVSPGEIGEYESEIDSIIDSFTFIDVLPLISINEPAKTAATSTKSYDIHVDWLAKPEELNMDDPIMHNNENSIVNSRYYKVGTITNGAYTDYALLDILRTPDGPATGYSINRVVYKAADKSFIYLQKYCDDLSYYKSHYTYDAQSTITDLDMPAELSIPDSGVKLAMKSFGPNNFISDHTNIAKLYDDSVAGAVYLDNDLDCFLAAGHDGLVKLYTLKLNFIKPQNSTPEIPTGTVIPEIIWNDNSGNEGEYSFLIPGCGLHAGCNDIVSAQDFGSVDALQVAGKTSTGSTVYEYKSSNTDELKNLYNEYYVPEGETRMTYTDFINAHPLFFWQTPFGYWVRFKSTKYQPMAECGKPVIYLYPEKNTKVNVQVAPTGGFSLTEPVYQTGGWNVTASPSGLLSDNFGFTYPYLFWEGKALNYTVPKQGFVVQRSQVASFLSETLIKLGLNQKESGQFMDFWVPKMQDKPYYFITFVDQKYFDQLAPLSVNPKPDTVIRVFMDYKSLDNPISVEPLKITTPVRHGFTVVEWGGALHK